MTVSSADKVIEKRAENIKSYVQGFCWFDPPTMFPSQWVSASLSSEETGLPAALVGLLRWISAEKVWCENKN